MVANVRRGPPGAISARPASFNAELAGSARAHQSMRIPFEML